MIVFSFLILLSLFSFLYFYMHQYNENNKKMYHFLWVSTIILFTIVSAIRYDVGTDYLPTYSHYFNVLKNNGYYHYEFLFLFLNKMIIFFHMDVYVLFFICSIFTIPAFFKFIKKNVEQKYRFLSVFLFITTTIYFATMNAVRQYIAIAILLYGYEYLKNNKIIKYLLVIVIASLFHTSVLVALALPIIAILFKEKSNKKLLIYIYALSFIFIFFNISSIVNFFAKLLPSRYAYYLNSSFLHKKNYLAIIKLIIPNILMILCIKNYNELCNKNKNFNYLFIAWFIYVIICNCFYGINVFIRIGWYFDYFILLIVPQIIEIYKHQYISFKTIKMEKSKLLMKLIIMNYLSLTIVSIFIMGGHNVIPYSTIFKIIF